MNLIVSTLIAASLQVSGWEVFDQTEFKWNYLDEMGFEVEVPIFDQKIKELEGSEITLTGYYLPIKISKNVIIISRLPYASCFFCGGGGGQESIAEVIFKKEPRRFEMDEMLTITGRLKLNVDDYDHPVFILVDAKAL